ncbi:MAG: DUF4266 domain-containing protein [Candidatus Didemnitutus sp.]|nr:DUF4266 domain-containing protein [Candidatus Didemnitutus sp.]
MKPLTRRLVLLAVPALAISTLTGCNLTAVQPWERGAFTAYAMRADRDPLAAAMSEHTYFSREATGGGRGVGGSGCGCN